MKARLAALALPLLAGCVERTMIIESKPAGAEVFVDGRRVGTTPAEVDFTWYGTRQIVLELDGYETHRVVEPVSPPWWQVPVLDLVTDVLIPTTLGDRHRFEYTLTPSSSPPDPGAVEQSAAPLRDRLEQP